MSRTSLILMAKRNGTSQFSYASEFKFFADNGMTIGWYVAATPSSLYDATGNKTWVTWEGFNPVSVERAIYVRVYDHASSTWGEIVKALDFRPINNDDHGVPCIAQLGDGRVVVIGEGHAGSTTMSWSITNNPRDESAWTVAASLQGQDYTYPHPHFHDGKLHNFIRRTDSADTKMPLIKRDITFTGVSASVGSEVTLIDFGTDSRNYQGNHIKIGSLVYIPMAFSNYNDTFRRHLYVFVYDLDNDTISNIDGSTSITIANFPIDLTLANSDFRVIDFGTDNGNLPSTALDENGDFHFLYPRDTNEPTDLFHAVYDNSTDTLGTPVKIGETQFRYESGGIAKGAAGTMVAYFAKEDYHEYSRGGDMAKRVYNISAGTWGAQETIAQADKFYPWDNPTAVLNGLPEFNVIFTQRAPNTNSDASGRFRNLYCAGYGTNGFVHSSITGQYEPHASTNALRSRLSTSVSEGILKVYDDLFVTLDDGGILSKLDILYVPGPTEEMLRMNIIKNAHNMTTFSGTPLYRPFIGVQGDGVSALISTNFNPTADAATSNYATTSAFVGASCNIKEPLTKMLVGVTTAGGGGSFYFWPVGSTGLTGGGRINDNGGSPFFDNSPRNPEDFIVLQRETNTLRRVYVNGGDVGTNTNTTAALPNRTFLLCGSEANSNYSDAVISTFALGASLTTSEHLILSNALRVFEDKIRYYKGAPAIINEDL